MTNKKTLRLKDQSFYKVDRWLTKNNKSNPIVVPKNVPTTKKKISTENDVTSIVAVAAFRDFHIGSKTELDYLDKQVNRFIENAIYYVNLFGLSIKCIDKSLGGYIDDATPYFEYSILPRVVGKKANIEAYSAVLGTIGHELNDTGAKNTGQEVGYQIQNAVLVHTPTIGGSTRVYSAIINQNKVNKTLDLLKKHEIISFSVNRTTNEITVVDLNNSYAQHWRSLVKEAHSILSNQHYYETEAKFINSGDGGFVNAIESFKCTEYFRKIGQEGGELDNILSKTEKILNEIQLQAAYKYASPRLDKKVDELASQISSTEEKQYNYLRKYILGYPKATICTYSPKVLEVIFHTVIIFDFSEVWKLSLTNVPDSSL